MRRALPSFTLFFLMAFFQGCQLVSPPVQIEEIALAIDGDSDRLLRIDLEKEFALAGYRISKSSRFLLKLEKLEIYDRNLGFLGNKPGQKKRTKACEADIYKTARVSLIDRFNGNRLIAKQSITAWTSFDFAKDKINKKNLNFSRGSLAVRDEARGFALRFARRQLAEKVVSWIELALANAPFQSGELNRTLSEQGAEQIVFPDIDQDPLEDF